ncbi:MAG TPA: hypothetical protein VGN80_08335 [Devosiaceae bacterium]|nr:hypothetical protein [Devosiaceae bacterium]
MIYLVGTSRGGTTVLQAALASFENVAAVGELKRLHALAANSAQCGCGLSVPQCPVWSKLLALPPVASLTKAETILASLRLASRLSLGGRAGHSVRSAANATKALASALGHQILVDSSKDIDRLVLHARNDDLNLVPVHVIRDPRGVLQSGIRRTHFSPDRIARNWFRVNAAIVALRLGTRHLRWQTVRYEDFCANPLGVCRAILAAAGTEHSLRTDTEVQHALGGSPGFRFDGADGITLQEPWREELSSELQQVALRRGGYIAKRFGYREE